MEITLKHTEDQIALIKAIASKNRDVAYEAKAAVAELVGPVISEVINNAPTLSNFYKRMPYSEFDNPSIPLDLFHDITDEQFIRVHSQTVAGGLSSNELYPAHDELKFKTYSLNSAWSVNKRYPRQARLDVISAIFTRMAQEFLLLQEKSSVNQWVGALVVADTKINGTAAAGNHVIDADTGDQLGIHDFNKLLTRSKRIWSNFSTGTPAGGARFGITDLIMSPEMTEEIRGLAYQPVNTRAVPNTDESTAIPATDEMRNQIMNSAGYPAIFDVNIIELLEMGINQRYNKIFDEVNTLEGSPVTFTQASDEILLGIDRSKPNALVRPVVQDEDSSSDVHVLPDDQYVDRSKKVGWYAEVNEARMVLEQRALTGLKV